MTRLSFFLGLLLVAGLSSCGASDGPVAPSTGPTAAAVDAGPPQPTPAGAVEALEGSVTLERGPAKRPAQREPLFPRDAIETGAEASAKLRFGQRLVELGPDGRFEVDTNESGVLLTVLDGVVLTRSLASGAVALGDEPTSGGPQGSLTIGTPFGLTRLGSGAEVAIDVDETSAQLDVKVGEIELVEKNGKMLTIGAGKKGALGKTRELPPIVIEIVAAAGRAERKPKDGKAFAVINPKALPVLEVGDVVRVRDGRFTLSPVGSGTRVSLLKGAEVELRGAQKGEGREVSNFEVRKGDLEIVAPRGQTTRLGIAPGVTLVSDLGGQFSLKRTASGFELESLAGAVRLEREGEEPVTVPSGAAASVPTTTAGKLSVRRAMREAVVLPPKAIRLYHSGLRRVALAWDDVEVEGPLRFQLASDSEFTKLLRDGESDDRFANVPAMVKGVYFWRVLKGDDAAASGQIFFAPEPRSADLSRLKNEVPESGETTTIYFQDKDKPPAVTLSWGAAESAAKYRVRVYREGELTSPVIDRSSATTSLPLAENALGEGKYLWSVTPSNAAGKELKGGRMNKLHLVFDNAVANLMIKSPREGEAGGATVVAAGLAPVGSRLFINGKAVPLDAQARFETKVAPVQGRVVFRLVQGGPESWTVRTVRAR